MRGNGWALAAAAAHVAGVAVACAVVLVDPYELQELYVVAGLLLVGSWVLIIRAMALWLGKLTWRELVLGWLP